MLRYLVLSLVLAGCRIGFDDKPASSADGGGEDTAVAACASYVTWGTLPSRYRTSSDRDWAMAEADCEADGGHLAVVSDLSERDELRARLATDELWIGLSDRISEGSYLEVTGAAPSYVAWPGAPPTNAGEDCVEILLNSEYEDTSCVKLAAQDYACECDGASAQAGAF